MYIVTSFPEDDYYREPWKVVPNIEPWGWPKKKIPFAPTDNYPDTYKYVKKLQEKKKEGSWLGDTFCLNVPGIEAKDIEVSISSASARNTIYELKITVQGNHHTPYTSVRVDIPVRLDPKEPNVILYKGVLKINFKAKPKEDVPKPQRLEIKEV